MEAVVSPAVAAADRRTPERLAVDRADDPAGNRTDRTRDHETDPRAGCGTDHVGMRARGCRGNGGESGGCQNKVTHSATPMCQSERATYHGIPFHKVDAPLQPQRIDTTPVPDAAMGRQKGR